MMNKSVVKSLVGAGRCGGWVVGGACFWWLAVLAPGLETPLPSGLPPGFEAVIYAAPPMINYPTFVCPGEAGQLFVSVDKNGSIDTKPDRGFIVKLVDDDGDGRADRRTDFAMVSSPRGLAYDGEWVYCLHPPGLSRFRDTDGDGVSDERQELVSGIGFDLTQRPPDHTSNGVTLAIDGWLYLAIGDFGFMEARGTDGKKVRLHAGGVVRVRPDGRDIEIFATGTRNTYEVAVDPWLNVFARDNTNDGGGWDMKVHALFYDVDMGYPRLFKNFADETMPTLGIYGGGSGVGATYVQEPAVPAPFGDMLYTADWGRNAIYYHRRHGEMGAWFDIGHETFCEIERPTSIQADAAGNMYIASWKGGEFTYKGEDVGYIALVRAPRTQPAVEAAPWPAAGQPAAGLARQLLDPSHRRRLAAQQVILRDPSRAREVAPVLKEMLEETGGSQTGRIAVLATAKLLMGPASGGMIGRYGANDPALKEFAIRLTGDRPKESPSGVSRHLIAALRDESDRVKTQAVIALSRLGRLEAAPEILAIAARAPLAGGDVAAEAAVEPRAATAVVKGTAGPRLHPLEGDITGASRLFLVVTDGGNGNGVDHADWVEPLLSGPSGEKKLTELPWVSATAGWSEARIGLNALGQPLSIAGRPVAWGIGTHAVSVIAYDLPAGHGWTRFAAMGALDDSSINQNPEAGSVQFQLYVDALPASLSGALDDGVAGAMDGRRSLPHVASRALIRLQAHEACFAALDAVDGDPAQRAAALRVLRNLHLPVVVDGLLERVERTQEDGLRRGLVTALIRLYFREADWDGTSWGTRPDTTGPYYKKETWSESPRIEAGVRAALGRASAGEASLIVAQLGRHSIAWQDLPMRIDGGSGGPDPQWAQDAATLASAMSEAASPQPGAVGGLDPAVAIERTLAVLAAGTADAAVGEKVFTRHGCAACHTVDPNASPKGPNLHDIARRYQPAELLMSILNPSATIAQGFPTHVIETAAGDTYAGFIIKESADEVVLRNMAAVTQVIKKADIKTRHQEEAVSSMTPGLVQSLPPEALAGLVKYFQDIK
jgi:putative membrane-bound dehydrogenase-like protein